MGGNCAAFESELVKFVLTLVLGIASMGMAVLPEEVPMSCHIAKAQEPIHAKENCIVPGKDGKVPADKIGCKCNKCSQEEDKACAHYCRKNQCECVCP